jgi:hypothetical protein
MSRVTQVRQSLALQQVLTLTLLDGPLPAALSLFSLIKNCLN